MSERVVRVDALARVEGEGFLHVKLEKGRLKEVRFRIFEPPRFFEAFLRGKSYMEVPDVTARICGICPVAYQMSSVHALESLFGARVPPVLRELRRLLYCAEWIESHALHVFMLHAPDFLGFPDALEMARKHKALVELGLKLKKTGNDLTALLGGREIHPVSVRPGGFYKVPEEAALRAFAPSLQWARGAAEKALDWAAGLDCPDFEQDYEFVSLRHPEEYPFNEGRVVSSRGLDIPVADFNAHFSEVHVPGSNALHSVTKAGGTYMVGPLARFNLNFDRLPAGVRKACGKAKLVPPVLNPFRSIAVRAAETWFACEEALRIIGSYRRPREPFVELVPRAGEGHGATEAPRGLLYHRYRTDASGTILEAQITPPTAQNQGRIEADLRAYIPSLLRLGKEAFSLRCEQAVRSYDPCISCATHFLKVSVDGDDA